MKRKYELKQRAERQAETRDRIVRATVGLHTTIGPAATTISAIAKEAGVQRHTVYAHFPDEETLFRACTSHWRAEHPFPDVADAPLGEALEAVYGWYESVATAYALFMRDAHAIPESAREDGFAGLADVLSRRYGRSRAARAAVGHALAFDTWRSLVQREGLTSREAAEAMTAFVTGASRPRTTSRGGRRSR
jgi:AcrR family transcriptional regulator